MKLSIEFFFSFFCTAFCSLCCFVCNAQYQENNFARYTTRDGLNDNYINNIYQDKRGYMWIASNGGLNRFDGFSFYNFDARLYHPSASLSYTNKIIEVPPNSIALVDRLGSYLLNTDNFLFKWYKVRGNSYLTTYRNIPWDIVPLPDNHIAVSAAAGFYVFDGKGDLRFRKDVYNEADIGVNRIFWGYEVFKMSANEYLLFYQNYKLALYRYKENTMEFVDSNNTSYKTLLALLPVSVDEWISKNKISDHEFVFLYKNKDSAVYYNHHSGFYKASALPKAADSLFSWKSKLTKLDDSTFLICGNNNGFYKMILHKQDVSLNTDPTVFFPGHKVNAVFVDKEKRLWLATHEGLLKQNILQKPISRTSVPAPVGDANPYGYVCSFRYKNKLYLGRYSWTNGLTIIDTAGKIPEKHLQFFGKGGWNEVRAIQCYHEDSLWLATSNGLLWLNVNNLSYGKVIDKNSNRIIPGIAALKEPHADGTAWFCGIMDGVVGRYHLQSRSFTWYDANSQPAVPFKKIKNIQYDSYGNVWLCGHSLARWNNALHRFDTLIKEYAGPRKFNDDIICISADEHGSLWLHNAFNGLLEYKIAEKKFIGYGTESVLPDIIIDAMSPVINNQLWFSSNNRLSQLNVVTKAVRSFDPSDGFSFSRTFGRSIYYDSTVNKFFITCNNDLVSFANSNTVQPDFGSTIILQEIDIIGKRRIMHPANNIVLGRDEDNLQIKFAVINYEEPDGYLFYYKMSAAEDWVYLGAQKNIVFTKMPAGKHFLHLKAVHKSGSIKTLVYQFKITLPFWKSAWFIALVVFMIALLMYWLYQRRVNSIKQRANLDKLLGQAEMKALHAQMNPHFVFNSLNSIREMILNNENKDASHYLNKFAQLIRIVLDSSPQTFISLRRTMEHLTLYVEMEKIRTSQFSCSFCVDEKLEADEILLPPMIIQPFIENAIWHGAMPGRHLEIKVDFKYSPAVLICEINDNGIGIDQSLKNKPATLAHNSVGILNVKNRIKLLNEKYGIESDLLIIDKMKTSLQENGTLVQLRLPLEINE